MLSRFVHAKKRHCHCWNTSTLNCPARLKAECVHFILFNDLGSTGYAPPFLLLCQSSVHFSVAAVISPASWREGQKLVKMVLGRGPQLPGQSRPATADGHGRTGGTLRHNVTSFFTCQYTSVLYYCRSNIRQEEFSCLPMQQPCFISSLSACHTFIWLLELQFWKQQDFLQSNTCWIRMTELNWIE